MSLNSTQPRGKVLVVDGTEHNRDLLARLLSDMGHDVVSVDSGQAALDSLATESFDLMLLDIMMPGVSGFEVLARRRKSARLQELPVIVISALDDMQSVVRSIELGAEDYLPTPFSKVLLRARVGAALEKKRLRNAERDYLLAARRQTLLALQKSEHLLQTVVSNAPIVLFALDSEGIFTLIEGLGLHLLGLTTEELLGRSVFDLAQGILPLIEGAQRALKGEDFTTILPINEKFFESRQLPLLDDDGRIVGVIGVATDITEREHTKAALQKAHDELELRVIERTGELSQSNALLKQEIRERRQAQTVTKESEARMRGILNTAADGIITIQEDGLIESFNPAAARIFGYADREVVGTDINRIMPGAFRRGESAPGTMANTASLPGHLPWGYIQQYRDSTGEVEPGALNQEVVGQRRDGSYFPMELALSVVNLDNRRLYTGIVRDITDRKRAEKALALARDQALEASRLKSEFLATVSHEIRTPMNGIIGMTELLLETELDDTQQEFAGIVRNEAFALLEIINDILDFSKIEAGKLILDSSKFSIRGLLQGIRELFVSKAVAQSLAFSIQLDERIPDQLIGDAGRLRQVLINLIGNAFKFTQQGQISISAKLEGHQQGWVQLRINVADTGIGIPEHAHASLFDSFTQADGSITRRYGGTGLGLAISKRLVELMDGTIGVESRTGAGSTFWFTVNLTEANASAPVAPDLPGHPSPGIDHADGAQAETPPPTPTIPARPLPAFTAADPTTMMTEKSEKLTEAVTEAAAADIQSDAPPPPAPDHIKPVLLVEDNPVNRQLALLQLKQLGYESSAVTSGKAAVAEIELRGGDYSVVLMDCQMPEMDGFAATGAIRQHESLTNQHIPIIAMTANAMQGDRERCIAAGMDDYVSKPVSKQALQEMLGKWTHPAPIA